MNCWIIPLLLLFWNQNGRGGCADSGCGCEPIEPPQPPCRPRERECDRNRDCDCGRDRDRDCGRDRDNDRDGCPCNNDSRFEPRFDARPFNNSGCGCDDK
ncbi:MAG: hypothetical protein K2L82_15485 [Lachnospiraceae bacterium]|nr:hypothetical protein [Lachnospiraceae bacterium]